jgi:hypothetical protein
MNINELLPYIYAALLAFIVWTLISSVMSARRSKRYQDEAAQRLKAIMESASADRERLGEDRSVSREHLQVTKELLSEIKALRSDLAKNESRNA